MALLVDLGGAIAVVAAFAIVVLAVGSRLAPADAETGFWDSLRRIAAAVDERAAALVLGGCIVILAALGTLVVIGDVPLEPFRVNAEQTVPTAFSGFLLVASGALALLVGRQRWGGPAWSWLVLGLGLIALGIDEMAELHERLELRTDLPTLIILAPLGLSMLAAGLATLPLLRERPPAAALFVAGGASGIASQALDPIHNAWKSVAEESLEMTSGALFLLALLAVAPRPPPGLESASGADRRPVGGASP